MKVVIADTGGANLSSLVDAFARLEVTAMVSSVASDLQQASHVILPGVGAALPAMQRLTAQGMAETIRQLQCPVLGICLGMQLLFAESDEGSTPCLGIIPGRIAALRPSLGASVPHMGWNSVRLAQADPLFAGWDESALSDFYFVHSYYLPPGPSTLATTEHATTLSAAIRWQNFWGVQFHPEKSATVGAKLLENFLCL